MALSTDTLYRPLNAIKDKLEDILDSLEDLNASAAIFGGVIGQQLPGNIQALTRSVEAMLDGGPSSIEGLIDFLDNVPMGEIRQKSASERREDRTKSTYQPETNNIDLTPDLSNGPRSATLQHESINIEDFYKDEFVGKKPKQFKESDNSWEAILNNPNIEATDFSGCDVLPGGNGAFNLNQFAEESALQYADEAENQVVLNEDEIGSIAPEDWKQAFKESDPISFGIINDNLAETGHLVE